MQTRENQILDMPIWKALILFFIPCWLGLMFQQLYNTVDTWMVGRFVGTDAVAAVGNVSIAVQVVIGICVGIASGSGVVISQHYGAQKMSQVRTDIRSSLKIAWIGGLVLTVICATLAGQMVIWLRTPADILADSTVYLRIYFLALVPILVYNFGTAVLRGMGDSKTPLYILAATSVLNIILDWLFVVRFSLGVFGVAVATDISQVVSALLLLWLLRRKVSDLWEPLEEPACYGQMFRIGLPTAVQSIMYSSSNVLIQVAINSFGSAVIAAWTIYGKVDCVCWMTMSAMGVAVTAFAGQNFGAGRYDRVKRGAWISSAMLGIALVFMVGACYVFARPIFAFFTPDMEVVDTGTAMLRFLAPAYMLYFLIEILPGVLRGCGDVLIPTLACMIGICLIRVLWLTLVVPIYHTTEMIMLSYTITWAVTSTFFLVYFLRGKWLDRCIARSAA